MNFQHICLTILFWSCNSMPASLTILVEIIKMYHLLTNSDFLILFIRPVLVLIVDWKRKEAYWNISFNKSGRWRWYRGGFTKIRTWLKSSGFSHSYGNIDVPASIYSPAISGFSLTSQWQAFRGTNSKQFFNHWGI